MRLLCVLTLLVAACNDGIAPPELTGDGGNDDMAVEDLGQPEDLAPAPDLYGSNTDLTGVDMTPLGCTSACDCPAGERCEAGSCTTSPPKVYCCGASTCPGSQVCETPALQVSQCGNPDGGIALDMGASACSGIACIPGPGSNAFCSIVCGAAGATCKTTAGTSHCSP